MTSNFSVSFALHWHDYVLSINEVISDWEIQKVTNSEGLGSDSKRRKSDPGVRAIFSLGIFNQAEDDSQCH